MSPEDFVTEVLVKQMHAKAVVAGPDCSFGHKGAGNAGASAQARTRNTVLRPLSSRKSRMIIAISAAPMSGRNWTGATSKRPTNFWGNPMPSTAGSCTETISAVLYWVFPLPTSFRRRRNTCRLSASMSPGS
ncbi:MAG: hypothetical protein ACLSE4_13790 [Clostridium sp.]